MNTRKFLCCKPGERTRSKAVLPPAGARARGRPAREPLLGPGQRRPHSCRWRCHLLVGGQGQNTASAAVTRRDDPTSAVVLRVSGSFHFGFGSAVRLALGKGDNLGLTGGSGRRGAGAGDLGAGSRGHVALRSRTGAGRRRESRRRPRTRRPPSGGAPAPPRPPRRRVTELAGGGASPSVWPPSSAQPGAQRAVRPRGRVLPGRSGPKSRKRGEAGAARRRGRRQAAARSARPQPRGASTKRRETRTRRGPADPAR